MGQARGGLSSADRSLRGAGVMGDGTLDAFATLMQVREGIGRGDSLVGASSPATHFSLLLEGAACSFTRDKEGARHIHAFRYPGDFLGLQDFLLPGSHESVEVEALSTCTVGIVDAGLLQHHSAATRALWRAA